MTQMYVKMVKGRKDDSMVEACHVPAGSKYYAVKYRENAVEDVIPIGSALTTVQSPARSQRYYT